MPPHDRKMEAPVSWLDRLRALRNVTPMIRLLWETSPLLTTASLIVRFISAFIPIGQLWVGKLIIDRVVAVITHRTADSRQVWIYLSLEIGLVGLNDLLARGGTLCDSLVGDKFTNYLNLRLMDHAG